VGAKKSQGEVKAEKIEKMEVVEKRMVESERAEMSWSEMCLKRSVLLRYWQLE
tara:strand:+ start:1786 stop:1944 length:159 start_codon:yes stop_codon:yes gene_type:complete